MDKEARRAAAHQLLQRCLDSGVNFSRTSTEAQNLVECGAALMANRVGDGFDEDAAFEQLKEKYGLRQQAEAKAHAQRKQDEEKEEHEEAAESEAAGGEEEEGEKKPKAKATPRKRKAAASKKQAEHVAESKEEGDDEDAEHSDKSSDDEGRSGKRRRKKKAAGASPKKAQAKISEQATVPENKELALAFYHLSRESFRVGDSMPGMAYAKVAKIIREFPEEIRAASQLKGIKGVGKASLAKIDEFLEQGYINKLEELRRM